MWSIPFRHVYPRHNTITTPVRPQRSVTSKQGFLLSPGPFSPPPPSSLLVFASCLRSLKVNVFHVVACNNLAQIDTHTHTHDFAQLVNRRVMANSTTVCVAAYSSVTQRNTQVNENRTRQKVVRIIFLIFSRHILNLFSCKYIRKYKMLNVPPMEPSPPVSSTRVPSTCVDDCRSDPRRKYRRRCLSMAPVF